MAVSEKNRRRSVTVKFGLHDDPELWPPYVEGLDLADGETIGGLFMWMRHERERQVLRTALTFDMFDVADDFLSYHSEDSETVELHANTARLPTMTVPRPPLLEVLDDWESFLSNQEPFEKVYSWDESNDLPLSPTNVENRSDMQLFRSASWDPSPSTTTVTLHFDLDDKNRPVVTGDSADRYGDDRMSGFFRASPSRLAKLRKLLDERKMLSVWSTNAVFRCAGNEVRFWTDSGSDHDDFLLLSRSQFVAMIDDGIRFHQSLKPFTQTYAAG